MWQRTASACRGPSDMPRREQSAHTDTGSGMDSGQAVTLSKDDCKGEGLTALDNTMVDNQDRDS